MKNKEQYKNFLSTPSVEQIKLRNSVDRYGFSRVLAARCNRSFAPYSFANWVHGWIWSESPTAEILACARLPRDLSIIVRNEVEKNALLSEGFTRVEAGGLPFCYIQPTKIDRSSTSLLAFPPHSAEAERVSSTQADYMDYLESLKVHFEKIYVSIFSIDLNGPMHQAAEKRGLSVIQGARPDDANSLIRMRSILGSFEYVSSNTMGSHMLYALYSGCKFSFSGPFYGYCEADFLANGNPHGHSEKRIENSLRLQSEDYVRQKFKKFFVSHPKSGIGDIDFARIEIGEHHIMTPKQIESGLGWSIGDQIKGYVAGGARKSKRIISRFLRTYHG